MVNIVAGKAETGKFFFQYGFESLLTSVPQRRLGKMLIGLAMKGNQSRATDFVELKQCFNLFFAAMPIRHRGLIATKP